VVSEVDRVMALSMSKVPLGHIPAPSTAFTSEAVLKLAGTTLSVEFEYDDEGVRKRSAVVFDGVRAHVHRVEGASTAWHVKDAFDTVCEVHGSPWLEEVESLAYERGHAPGELHHYVLYLDSSGSYEAIARSWAIAPEVLV
jgi:hypothetical protein